jgi:hypothetical protein
MQRIIVRAVGTLAVAGVLLLPTGCKSPVVATRSGPGTVPTSATPTGGAPAAGTAPTAAPTGAAPATSPAGAPAASVKAGRGAGGPGTVTVSITEPVSASGHAGSGVTCITGRVYTATAQSAVIEGYQVFFTVRVAPYHGPDTYPAMVTVRLNAVSGAVTTVSAVPNVNAVISDAGGSFTIHATGDNGRTLNASLQWTCS